MESGPECRMKREWRTEKKRVEGRAEIKELINIKGN